MEKHVEVLKNNLIYMKDNIVVNAILLAQLLQDDVITTTEKEEIEQVDDRKGSSQAVVQLVSNHLMKKPDKSFHKFLQALRETSHDHVADKLIKEYGTGQSNSCQQNADTTDSITFLTQRGITSSHVNVEDQGSVIDLK